MPRWDEKWREGRRPESLKSRYIQCGSQGSQDGADPFLIVHMINHHEDHR